jgi:hypothetical protein
MNNENIRHFIETKGYNLEIIGIQSFGFLKEDALKFIELLLLDNIPILGGDVLLIDKNNTMQLIFDGWYCKKEESETNEQYIKKSGMIAIDYICKYNNEYVSNSTFLFDIVFDRKLFLELGFQWNKTHRYLRNIL